ncbi:histidine phosphatase superfamily [Irpex lacteus]|nr:histidine phosphatase superfamily [Irpex lacteus]
MASEKESLLPLTATDPPVRTRRSRLPLLGVFIVVVFWSLVHHEVIAYNGLALWTRITESKHSLPIGIPDEIQHQWGQYSPYHRAGKYTPPPKGCELIQVNILQRHGIRYPNEHDDYDESVDRLMSAEKLRSSKLKFLKNYEYKLKEEALTPLGAQQSFESGVEAFRRYSHLVSSHTLPFVRASRKGRVVDSSGNWTIGFSVASNHHIHPTVDQILSESVNNTLYNDCPNASQAEEEKNTWLSVFTPPIVARLRKAAPKANITEQDVHNLMALCPFESLGLEKRSPFCGLFSEQEFREFEYFGDVEKYYKTGYGNPLGPIQGVGYVNELLARLAGSSHYVSRDKTQHNHSLPFPLDRTVYVDFTHENSQVAVFAALGIFNVSKPLDLKKMPKEREGERKWVASRMVPFSGRMVVEKLVCEKGMTEGEEQFHETPVEDTDGTYVRVLVNDALQPLEFCGGKKEGKWNGVCALDTFVESQGYARRNGDGDFKRCYN